MEKYKDIIDIPYVKSNNRPHMSLHDRAAQFAPFSALSGYEESLKETSRITDKKVELLEEDIELISSKLHYIINYNLTEEILFTYFIKDKRKSGGKYVSLKKIVKRIDEVMGGVYFNDNSSILISDIIDISSPSLNLIFNDINY